MINSSLLLLSVGMAALIVVSLYASVITLTV